MDNNHILIGLVVLTISCIYLFYLNFQKNKEFEELSMEVKNIKYINTITNNRGASFNTCNTSQIFKNETPKEPNSLTKETQSNQELNNTNILKQQLNLSTMKSKKVKTA